MSNNVDLTNQSVLFPSDEVSPVVLRDKSRSQRCNMVQNHPKHISNPAFSNNFLSNTNIPKPSILLTPCSSMINVKNYSDNYGTGVEEIRYCGVNTDGVIMNPMHLHQQQIRTTSRNETKRYRQSLPAPGDYLPPNNSNTATSTNFDPYPSRHKNLHEMLGNNKFSVSRKASPTKVDYTNTNSVFPSHCNDRNDKECGFTNLNHANIPMIIETTPNDFGMQRRISPQEQLLWANGLNPPTSDGKQLRKLSSPPQLGGISMDDIGATGNSIYLRHGTSFNGLNMVLNNFASNHTNNAVDDEMKLLTILCMNI